MSTQFLWTGALGASKTDWNDASGTLTNWRDLANNSTTIVPGAVGDEASFSDGGADTVSGTARVDHISIGENTFVTINSGNIDAGDLIAANNAGLPDDLVVDDDSKLVIASGAGMENDGTVSVIGLGAGASGAGTLEVDSGGSFGAEGLIIGDSVDGNGIVTANGAGGFFVVAPFGGGSGNGELTIGNAGTGSLGITGTAAFFSTSAVLGVSQGAAGTLTLDSSTWGGGAVTIGAAGVGVATIGSGATVAVGDVVLGSAAGGSGSLSVTGADFAADALTVGADGTATATFGVNSTGTFTAVTVGASAGAVATLAMDGSTWNTGSLTIGDAGDGHARAGSGEAVTFNDAVLGSGADVSGDLTIDAATLNGGTLAVGHDGTGELAIESGSTGNVTSVTVGEDDGSSGTLTIDNSDWGAGTLAVGMAGSGQATVANGAASTLDNILIGPNGGLAVTQAAGAVGTVTAQQVTLQFGTLDVSAGGMVLVGAAAGAGGVVSIGSTASLTGLGLLEGEVDLSGDGAVQATGPVAGALEIDGAVHGSGALQPLMTLEVNGAIDPGVTIAFGASTAAEVGDLVLDVPAGEQGTITGFGAGNTIDVQGSRYSSAVFSQGGSGEAGTLVLSGGTAASLSLPVLGDYASDAFTAAPGSTDTIVTVVPCFAAGTRVATTAGPVAVENLAVGDRVATADGTLRPVIAIVRRRATVWPVRVAAGAFAAGVPGRDLYLSPDHSVFVDGVLTPVKLLINGGSIAGEARQSVDYYHVRLPRHAVLFAEGLAAESYLDTEARRGALPPRPPLRAEPLEPATFSGLISRGLR